MFELTPQDDFIHARGTEESWRESYSFDFYDPATRLSGLGLMGANPNQETGDCLFGLWRDDILLAKSVKWDFHLPQDIGEERQHFGPMAFRPVAPFKTWEVSYDDGYCRLELAFDSIHPPYSWLQSSQGTLSLGSHHYQQQGRYRGVVRVGKESIPVQAHGTRDHGWGPDARANVRRGFSASAQFSDKLAFQALHVSLADGKDLLFGYVFRGSQNELVERSRLSASYTLRHSAPSGCNLELSTAGGERMSIVARVLNAFNTSFQERKLPGFRFSCAAEFQMNGQTGFGRLNVFWRDNKQRPEAWSIEPPGVVPEKLKKIRGNVDDTVY
jgi:hypothetical protein